MKSPVRCQRCLSWSPPGCARCQECGAPLRGRRAPAVLLLATLALTVALGWWFHSVRPGSPPVVPPADPAPVLVAVAQPPAPDSETPAEPVPADAVPQTPAPFAGAGLPRQAALELRVRDAEGVALRDTLGFVLFEPPVVLVPVTHLNGASTLAPLDARAAFPWVAALDPEGAALLAAPPDGPPAVPLRESADLVEGEPLFALAADAARHEAPVPAGTVAARADGRVEVAGTGSLHERFVFDAGGRLVGIGARRGPDGRVRVLGVEHLRALLPRSRRTHVGAADFLFANDAAARRERAALYALAEEWSKAAAQYVVALELEPARPELVREGLVAALRLALERALRRGEADTLVSLLERAARWLDAEPAVHELLGLALLESGDPEGALDALRRAGARTRSPSPRLREALRAATLRAGERARALGRLAEARQFLEAGLLEFRDDLKLLKSLGYVHYESGDDAAALAVLSRVAALDAGQAAALAPLLARLEDRAARQPLAEIRFDPRAGVIESQAWFNRAGPISVLVDTGASLTVLSYAAARQLGIDVAAARRSVEVMTANGRVRAPLVRLDEVNLQGAVRRDLDAVVLDLDGSAARALIGNNFLDAFEVAIDAERGSLRLSPLR